MNDRLRGIGVGGNGYRFFLLVAFSGGVKDDFDAALFAGRYGFFGPFRYGTSTGRAGVADEQGDAPRIGEFKDMGDFFSGFDGAKIKILFDESHFGYIDGVLHFVGRYGIANDGRDLSIGREGLNTFFFFLLAAGACQQKEKGKKAQYLLHLCNFTDYTVHFAVSGVCRALCKTLPMSKNTHKVRDEALWGFLRPYFSEDLSRIFLWGPMGSGKTTLGRKLARRLSWPFIDLDAYIERAEGRSIAELFEAFGEPAFRQMEGRALRRVVAEHPRLLLATGGGTPCFYDHADYMLESGLCIYLKTPPEVLWEHLRGQMAARPLLRGMDKKEVLNFFQKQIKQREEWYLRAELFDFFAGE